MRDVLEAEHVLKFIAATADAVCPVTDIRYAMPFEKGEGVIAEACLERAHLAGVRRIDAELIDHRFSLSERTILHLSDAENCGRVGSVA